MGQKKTKIVLDADVIIHFIKGECFTKLADIFPEYEYIILDVVYDEISQNKETKTLIDNYIHHIRKIKKEKFTPQGDATRNYFELLKKFGRGESACMIYCRNNQDVLGSSNLRDITAYCAKHSITYLTTLDFLYYAYRKGKMSDKECYEFMCKVNDAGSNIPILNITEYSCTALV